MFGFLNLGTPKVSRENIFTYAHILSTHAINGTLDINAVKELYDFSITNQLTENDIKEAQSEACYRVWAALIRDGLITHAEEEMFNKFLCMCSGLTATEKADWQKKLNDTQLTAFSKQNIVSNLKIFYDCVNIIDSSANVETVLMRYQLAIEKISVLKTYTELQLSAFDISRSKLIELETHLINNKVEIINEIIDRAYSKQIVKVNTFQKQSSRDNSMAKFFKKITDTPGMPSGSLDYCYALMSDYGLTPEENAPVPFFEPVSSEISINKFTSPVNRTSDTDAFLNIPDNIVRLLWFKDGNLKNYVPMPRKKSSSGMITLSIYGAEEPSAISIKDVIGTPIFPAPGLSYFPSYKELCPEARGNYLHWLRDITQPIDIGYVFIFYYGLERHLFDCSSKSLEAFETIELLRKYHDNPSFQSYSQIALLGAAIKLGRKDLLERALLNKQYFLDNFTLACYSLLEIPLTANDLIAMASQVGFYNKRYIKQQPVLFVNCLKDKLREKFGIDGFLIGKPYLNESNKIKQRLAANISLEDIAAIDVYSIRENPRFRQDVATLLNDTHETVKVTLREARKKKK